MLELRMHARPGIGRVAHHLRGRLALNPHRLPSTRTFQELGIAAVIFLLCRSRASLFGVTGSAAIVESASTSPVSAAVRVIIRIEGPPSM